MDNKKKLIILIVSIIALILLIIGGTYAFITWSSNENQATNVVFTVTPDFSCSADAGGHITSNDRMLAPTDCMDPEYAIQRTISTGLTNESDGKVYYDLWLDVNNIGSGLSGSQNFKYALTQQADNCVANPIVTGTFNGVTNGDVITLLIGNKNSYLSSATGTYYLYIWLDEAETDINTQNQNFDFSINGRCSNILYGDANGDGEINSKDITRINRYISNSTTEIIYDAADVNVDGVIDSTDSTILQNYIKNNGKNIILGPH